MKHQKPIQFLILLTLILAAVLSCATLSREIPSDITAGELFQKGQDAYNEYDDLETAVYFYEEYLSRFPDDMQKVVEVEYEIAFIYYKEKQYDEAETRLLKLIDRYSDESAQLLPVWPLTLAEQLVLKINEIRNPSSDDVTQ